MNKLERDQLSDLIKIIQEKSSGCFVQAHNYVNARNKLMNSFKEVKSLLEYVDRLEDALREIGNGLTTDINLVESRTKSHARQALEGSEE